MKMYLGSSLGSRAAISTLVGGLCLVSIGGRVVAQTDVLKARGGDIRITPQFHGSLTIEYGGTYIAIDPVSAAANRRQAGFILITHSHPDHFDKAAIKAIWSRGTRIVAPGPVIAELKKTGSPGTYQPLVNGEIYRYSFATTGRKPLAIGVEAVPMYNLARGPKAGEKFHPKGAGNGYVLTLGGKRLYIAGDTEATPEMKRLKNIDVAFLPMNLPFTMTPQEAAAAARAFKPRIVYPYHYRYPFNKSNTNPQQFAAPLKGSGVAVRLREWYPAPAVSRAMAPQKSSSTR